ncbi:hypothetical protein B0T17DRAFT_596442 [Bombardia bombarda]|uniref:Uncharacterized protein n=1 Tax=Bombardia bombarda TaxID=252184 RepID=A0AA39XQ48_9PEZI|nr:hypothetical protein B0T17DRAFT_596442 [Bombardia bombarda]
MSKVQVLLVSSGMVLGQFSIEGHSPAASTTGMGLSKLKNFVGTGSSGNASTSAAAFLPAGTFVANGGRGAAAHEGSGGAGARGLAGLAILRMAAMDLHASPNGAGIESLFHQSLLPLSSDFGEFNPGIIVDIEWRNRANIHLGHGLFRSRERSRCHVYFAACDLDVKATPGVGIIIIIANANQAAELKKAAARLHDQVEEIKKQRREETTLIWFLNEPIRRFGDVEKKMDCHELALKVETKVARRATFCRT